MRAYGTTRRRCPSRSSTATPLLQGLSRRVGNIASLNIHSSNCDASLFMVIQLRPHFPVNQLSCAFSVNFYKATSRDEQHASPKCETKLLRPRGSDTGRAVTFVNEYHNICVPASGAPRPPGEYSSCNLQLQMRL